MHTNMEKIMRYEEKMLMANEEKKEREGERTSNEKNSHKMALISNVQGHGRKTMKNKTENYMVSHVTRRWKYG